MTDEHTPREYADLEVALLDLGRHLGAPPSQATAAAVRAHLEQHQSASRWPRLRILAERAMMPAIAFLLIAAVVLAASPAARGAVATWFELRGVVITTGRPPAPVGHNLALGRPITLDEAGHQLPFAPLVPTRARIAHPDAVYLARVPFLGDRLSLVYAATGSLPALAHSRVGLLLTEFQATTDRPLLEKVVQSGSQVDPVTVNGQPGFWVHGPSHFVIYRRGNEIVPDTLRLSGDALVWQHGQVTLRIESSLSKEQTIRLARSIRRVS